MSSAFIDGVKAYCSTSQTTFDKWRAVKLLHKNLADLGEKSQFFSEQILLLMGRITDFYRRRDCKELVPQLQFVADFAQEPLLDNPVTQTIRSHFEGSAHYDKSGLANAILEGINSKIQVIKRVARGFRRANHFKKCYVSSLIIENFK